MGESPPVVVIGCGGIWSYLRGALCRLMAYSKEAPRDLVLVDGDHFTPSNMDRQDMTEDDVMKNKAVVHAERIRAEFGELRVRPVGEFVTVKNIGEIIRDGSLVVSCVDNHSTRRLIASHARTLKNVVVLTGASDMDSGNVHIQAVSSGRTLSRGIDEVHPEVAAGGDRNPGDLSCEERARLPGGGQQISTNFFTAALMGTVIAKLFESKKGGLEKATTHPEVFYNLRHMAMDASRATLGADVFGGKN